MDKDARLDDHRRRRRPALSCIECRRRKVKCDRQHPCAHCVACKVPCSYATRNALPSPPEPVTASTLSRNTSTARNPQRALTSCAAPHKINPLLHVADQVHDIQHTQHKTDAAKALTSHLDDIISDEYKNNNNNNESKCLGDLSARVYQLDDITQQDTDTLAHGQSCSSAPRFGLFALHTSINKTRVSRWSHSIAEVTEFENGISYFNSAFGMAGSGDIEPEIQPLVLQATELLRKSKAVARHTKLERPTRSHLQLSERLGPPRQSIADRCFRAYFQHFETTYRILHGPTFQTTYEQYWKDTDGSAMELRLHVLLVVAIGSVLLDEEDLDFDFISRTHHWIYTAQKWLAGPLEKGQLSISSIQLHCLCILARQTLNIGGDLIWSSMGSLLHMAMQAGLHRDPKHLPAMSLLQCEVRRRLWLTVLEMTVQSALDSEMPPMITTSDYDTEAPSNINDDEIDDKSTTLITRPENESTSTSEQIAMHKSFHIRLQIVQLLNGLSSSIAYEDVLNVSAAFSEICGSVYQARTGSVEDFQNTFQANVLEYLCKRFLLHLHLPFACRAGTNPLFQYSRKVCADTAMLLTTPEQNDMFDRFTARAGGPFKHTMRYASVAISLELLSQTRRHQANGAIHRLAASRSSLKETMYKLLCLTTERIKHGESNVKNHVFLSMVLAEVDAIERGMPIKNEIACKSLESLEFCHNLLQTQAGRSTIPDFTQLDFANLDLEQPDLSNAEFDFADFLQYGTLS